MKVIILAGGSGIRLWPLSRERYPKQFIKFESGKTSLFQETFKRSLLLTDLENIYVVTNQMYKFLVMDEIEKLEHKYSEHNILVEPEAKNTLPAIYAGVNEIIKKGHDTVIVFPSDHVIQKIEAFVENLKTSEELTDEFLITFGIQPDRPHTGYGYISPGEKNKNGFIVKEFKEKPDHETALTYIKYGYYWNSGIFMFSSQLFLEEVKHYAPEISLAFEKSSSIDDAFARIKEKISIDYGIMEKSSKVAIVPVDIGWNDLGSFDALYDVLDKDEGNNIACDNNIMLDCSNNLIYSEDVKLVATVGVNDLIVIDSRDALLICKKGQSQRVSEVVKTLKTRSDLRLEYHVQEYHPWGHYKILEDEKDSFKIKRISVNPGQKLSYQLHHYRSENWIVVKGIAEVTINNDVTLLRPGESIFMKSGQKHCLENPGKLPLEIIEVQIGSYLEVDDIVRFEDAYDRQ